MLATIIGRGHGGTRAAAQIFACNGVWMGPKHNGSDDLVPFEAAYEAARIIGKQVRHLGGLRWDFDRLWTGPIDPAWKRSMYDFLAPILESQEPRRGWKLPETIFSYPWLVREYPQLRVLHWTRDPRDALLKHHDSDYLGRFNVPHEVMGSNDDPATDVMACRIESWAYQTLLVRSAGHRQPDWYTHVRFEDWCAHPRREQERIGELLELTGPVAGPPVFEGRTRRWQEFGIDNRVLRKLRKLAAPEYRL